MPELDIRIGGRTFTVACQAGEEPFLQAAAALLDAEAAPLAAQVGRLPEARLLLMAGLMLADRSICAVAPTCSRRTGRARQESGPEIPGPSQPALGRCRCLLSSAAWWW